MAELDFKILYQFDKYLLQIGRLFIRSQPTPNPSWEGKLGVRINGFDIIF
ncbi:hypothetical protein [Okeania sp. SIO2B9]|nr:hypothetical protein [Okeania sp. SIO2B9]